jgi:hypothetical protein
MPHSQALGNPDVAGTRIVDQNTYKISLHPKTQRCTIL